jgi:hypothetical protein
MNAIGSIIFGVRSVHLMVFVTSVERVSLAKRIVKRS